MRRKAKPKMTTTVVGFRVNRLEWERLHKLAEAHGFKSVSTMLRQALYEWETRKAQAEKAGEGGTEGGQAGKSV